jgi:aspartate racemase
MLLGEASPVPLLLEGLRLLGEADFALIVCNTAHIFIQELRDHSDLPILDMVAETIRAVADDRRKRVKVGLLGTTGTLESRLYQETSRTISSHLEFITPLELKVGKLSGEAIQKRYVTDVIFGRSDCPDELGGGIKAGAHNEPRIRRKMRARLTRLVRWLAESGAHTVILGCTELPIVLGSGSLDGVSLIDPLEIVASSAVKIAAGVRPLPR